MIEELARRSNDAFQMEEGTLYPILPEQEKSGCLTAYQQEAPTGRVRKYYHITKKGKSPWMRSAPSGTPSARG